MRYQQLMPSTPASTELRQRQITDEIAGLGLCLPGSLVERTTEQELLPVGRALGLGVVAWSPLGGGMLTAALTFPFDGRRR